MLFQNDFVSEVLCTMVEVPGTDVFGILMEELRMCLALDTDVRQACETPEPAKSVQILFRGDHGLGAVTCGMVFWEEAGWRFGWVLCHHWREDP